MKHNFALPDTSKCENDRSQDIADVKILFIFRSTSISC